MPDQSEKSHSVDNLTFEDPQSIVDPNSVIQRGEGADPMDRAWEAVKKIKEDDPEAAISPDMIQTKILEMDSIEGVEDQVVESIEKAPQDLIQRRAMDFANSLKMVSESNWSDERKMNAIRKSIDSHAYTMARYGLKKGELPSTEDIKRIAKRLSNLAKRLNKHGFKYAPKMER